MCRRSRMPIICFDNLLNEPMPHDIPFIEIHELNTGNILKDIPHFNQAGDAV